jgi:hypothetical protein
MASRPLHIMHPTTSVGAVAFIVFILRARIIRCIWETFGPGARDSQQAGADMLLGTFSAKERQRTHLRNFRSFALTLLFFGTHACAQRPPLLCVLEVPTYDPVGHRLSFRVVAVTPLENTSIDLQKVEGESRMSVSGDRVFFSREVLGRAIEITLEGQKVGTVKTAARTKQRIELSSCRQRDHCLWTTRQRSRCRVVHNEGPYHGVHLTQRLVDSCDADVRGV